MERFVLGDVCNELLAELNRDVGKRNIIRLGIDIQLPDVYYGKPDRFVNALWLLSSHLAGCLVNGIISIEIALRQRHLSDITMHVQISGQGADYLAGEMQLDILTDNLGIEISHKAFNDRMQIEFNYTLQTTDMVPATVNPPFYGRRILLAEDNEVNAMVFDSFLEEWGSTNKVVANGADAVSAVGELTFDAILMDIHMPVMNGILATKKIREFNVDLPIIALTASTREIDIREVMDAGATDYLLKPVSSAHMFQVLSKYLIPGR